MKRVGDYKRMLQCPTCAGLESFSGTYERWFPYWKEDKGHERPESPKEPCPHCGSFTWPDEVSAAPFRLGPFPWSKVRYLTPNQAKGGT
jgi:hypothetical protein